MRRTVGMVSVVAAMVVTTAAWRANVPHSSPTLHGGWAATSWKVAGATQSTPQPGLIVFTETHYSMMYVDIAEARARYTGDQMTDAEILAAYNTLTANSGRYEVSGNLLTTRAFVAKDPNYMGDWPENASVYNFRLEGDSVLHMEWPSDWPEQRSGTFRKVEGRPAPW